MIKTAYSFKTCECGETFMTKDDIEKCDDCLDIAPREIEGAPQIGQHSRLGDDHFKSAPSEWKNFLKTIHKNSPGSKMNVK